MTKGRRCADSGRSIAARCEQGCQSVRDEARPERLNQLIRRRGLPALETHRAAEIEQIRSNLVPGTEGLAQFDCAHLPGIVPRD